MAQQPDISQILAALAAGRTAGPAPQNQPPPQQSILQGYPGSYPNPTPPAASASYPLPQPTNTGNVDLSNIKPTNSGSVSLADAIARARGYAAEKGVLIDASRPAPQRDGDPRLAGRTFRRSRSRSRSPPRVRDNFRDNYNPYRDERRDDPRRANGRSFSRERSFSPTQGRGAPGNFPQLGYRVGGGDEGVETIVIDSGLVGLIIGRQGENLRRVEKETATRVQFITGPEATGPKRQCKITGTRKARDDAKAEIARIIEENGNPDRGNVPPERLAAGNKQIAGTHQPPLRAGEDASQIMVPNRTVGLIIGRGGETIRDLQERSQCHVNIVGEDKSINGLRPVNLIGTPQAAAYAKELIMEIVDSDTKNMVAQSAGAGPPVDMGRGPSTGHPGFGGADNSGGQKYNDSMTVPSEAVGMIIGKGGETIKDMQSTTGCKINVAQPSGPDLERSIGLVGTRPAIEAAKRAIMDKVHAVEEKNRPGGGTRRDDQYGDRYSQPQQQPYQQPAMAYGQQAQSVMPQGGPGGAAEADPYAMYGGIQNYYALWYAAAAQQGQQQPGQAPQGQGSPGQGHPGAA